MYIEDVAGDSLMSSFSLWLPTVGQALTSALSLKKCCDDLVLGT
jgi:hypothetical protein